MLAEQQVCQNYPQRERKMSLNTMTRLLNLTPELHSIEYAIIRSNWDDVTIFCESIEIYAETARQKLVKTYEFVDPQKLGGTLLHPWAQHEKLRFDRITDLIANESNLIKLFLDVCS